MSKELIRITDEEEAKSLLKQMEKTPEEILIAICERAKSIEDFKVSDNGDTCIIDIGYAQYEFKSILGKNCLDNLCHFVTLKKEGNGFLFVSKEISLDIVRKYIFKHDSPETLINEIFE